MPTYAYACTTCERRFEVQQSFSDAALTECPECQGRLRKLFNSVGIVFKGSGFYRTDSRNGSKSESPAGSGTGSGADGASAAAKPETSTTSSGSSSDASSKSPKTTPATTGSAA